MQIANFHQTGLINQSFRQPRLFLGLIIALLIFISACSAAPTEVPPTPGPISDEALMDAVKSEDVAEVARLLEGGADPNYEQDGTMMMLVAVSRGNLEVLKLLVDNGGLVYADNLPFSLQIVQLSDPVTKSETEFFNYLLAEVIALGGELDQPVGMNGSTSLFVAAWDDNHGLMKLLTDAGADINRSNDNGVTPLMWASFQGRIETVRLIVELGADLDYQDFEGETALHVAIRGEQAEVVQYLVDVGAPLDIETDSGESVIDYAKSIESEEILRILEEAGAG